jgi:ABC-type multidrug transport system ATPase subunit
VRGVFILGDAGAVRVVELVKGSRCGFEASGGGIELREAGDPGDALFSVTWDASQGTWILEPGGAAPGRCFWRGGDMPPVVALADWNFFQAADSGVWFRKFPQAPVFRGAAPGEIPALDGLVFGRMPTDADGDDLFVGLDPEDRKISRRHVSLASLDGRFAIRDESQTGTYLNGQRFEKQVLAVGDRFLLGAYSFEFTGLGLRRTQPRIGGKVEAAGVGFSAGGRQILRAVDLHVDPCSFVGILGGSGQGKSTLLNALCGINPATEGAVLVEGRAIDDPAAMRMAGIGFVPQDDIVHPELRVRDAILYSARLRLNPRIPPREMRALVDETIVRLGLAEHAGKRILQLSGGQRKRVSIATELLAKPAVLFLDEPSSGLDPATEFALMKILRGLAARDCTVICTTHVLGRAYLFDKIVFIHGGRIIFDGPPDAAGETFGVESLDQVYVRVAEEGMSGDDWASSFEGSRGELPVAEPAPPQVDLGGYGDLPPPPREKPGFVVSLWVQLQRQWSIMAADTLNLVFLLAQPLLIAVLVGWVAEDYVLRMFLCVVATLWFGCSNGAQQIIRELPIFRRERVCGLGLNAYLSSKYLFLGLITTLQALLLLAVVQTTSLAVRPPERTVAGLAAEFREITTPPEAAPLAATAEEIAFEAVEEGVQQSSEVAEPAPPAAPSKASALRPDVWIAAAAAWFFELRWNVKDAVEGAGRSLLGVVATTVGIKLLALAATALVGIAIGLAISSLVQNTAQAVMWVPLLLIPQILFGGVVLSLPELSRGARAVCAVIPSFSCQRLMDVSNVYGQAVPLLSNRTKIPLFLTPGEKEAVQWSVAGREFTEYYDKLSPGNTSWQNLAVFPFAAGQHRHAFSTVRTAAGSTRKLFNETTETRDDVRYSKGRVFLNLAPARTSAAVLGGWIALCYGGAILSLSLRQKGK